MRTQTAGPVPRLDVVHGRLTRARDVVVLAHGGQEHSYEAATDLRPALLRMWPLAAAATSTTPDACVALARYRYRGWNAENAHPNADLRTLLDRLPATVERVVLIGHSMGGRAVMANAADERVVGVLALAPWLPADEPLARPDGALVVTAHGTDDTITAPGATAAYVRRLRADGCAVAEFEVGSDTHAMLRRHRDWSELVRRSVRSSLGPMDPVLAAALTIEDRDAAPLPRWHRTSTRAGAAWDVTRARRRLRRV